MPKKSSLLYAFDPDSDQSYTFADYRAFWRKWNLSVTSIAVLQSPEILTSQARARWEIRMKKVLARMGIAKFRLLLSASFSREETIRIFLQAWEKSREPWIAVTSHARWGLKRWATGSFAETLLLRAKVPVIFVPNQWKNTDGCKLLFVTDFSVESFQQLEYIRRHLLLEEIVLYHSLNLPLPYGGSDVTGSFSESFFTEQEASAKQLAERWVKKISPKTAIRYVIDCPKLGFLSGNQVLAQAKREKIDLLAISSRSTAVERFFFGSAAYELFRRKSLPVIVFGPKFHR